MGYREKRKYSDSGGKRWRCWDGITWIDSTMKVDFEDQEKEKIDWDALIDECELPKGTNKEEVN